jgi:murein DD-endopeptidase MepM/ murein hydrolase activator NlpD
MEEEPETIEAVETKITPTDRISGVFIEKKEIGYQTLEVKAKVVLQTNAQLSSLQCVIRTTDTEEILAMRTSANIEETWVFSVSVQTVYIVVTAVADSGYVSINEVFHKFAPPAFIWPVEPAYQMTVHDYYQVRSGVASVLGFTHNNGKYRKRHYVRIDGREHYALDITVPQNTPVYATAAGTITSAGFSSPDGTDSSESGNNMTLEHDDLYEGQKVFTRYLHLTKFVAKKGHHVKQGEIIGYSGNTGGSRIPHLHFEVRLGKNDKSVTIDPLEILPPRHIETMKGSLPGGTFPDSSVALYKSLMENQYNFKCFVKAKEDLPIDEINVIEKGSLVELVKRTYQATTIKYKGSNYSFALNAFDYTYDF